MTKVPKEHPYRPLYLAARSARLLGLLLVLAGVLAVVGAVLAMNAGPSRGASWASIVIFLVAAIYLGFGFTFRIVADKLTEGKLWAIYTAMVLASLTLLSAVVGLIRGLLSMSNPVGPPAWVLVIQVLAVAAFGQMLMHLIQGYKNLKSSPMLGHGFTPIMPAQPVDPPQFPPADQ